MSQKNSDGGVSRRRLIQGATAMGLLAGFDSMMPAFAKGRLDNSNVYHTVRDGADIYDMTIARTPLTIGSKVSAQPITINGTLPAPLVRLKQGRDAIMRVTNTLAEPTSIHWHGVLLPFQMDGVPGVSFPGIMPGETFEYRFPVEQSGTYWYHSHSGFQEQLGHYGPIIIDPAEPEPVAYDREYVVVLSDWTFDSPSDVFRHLKVAEGYYNYNQRTVGDFFKDVETTGWDAAWSKAGMWGQMRMSPRDILDVTGSEYTYLMNGSPSVSNWTGLFRPGEKIRLRFINASAMTFFDVRIPGLPMTVISADGQPVRPVETDEFRIGVAETYDVIVEPTNRAHTVFAQSQDRSGFVRGTLASRKGLEAPVPPMYPRTERGMAAMGMGAMDMSDGMDKGHGQMEMNGSGAKMAKMNGPSDAVSLDAVPTAGRPISHGPDNHGPGAAMVASSPQSRLDDPGVGFETADHRVLTYSQLQSIDGWPDKRPAEREVELHLTGNMERYMWSFDGKKFSEVDGPVKFYHGERLRLILVNDSMMDHPIHLHGMWMELETGADEYRPRKHTIAVKPGERVSALITADAPGDWAFHCHLLYHMDAGMFRVVSVV
ncbi:copper-resistance protein, CopA family [Marinobacter sp. LV10R510-11A]|uniref:copper resistance system multicopper oxidase n=1 Tax=Marinobacter sp. LV10R510-11A TaxID=1415568 RepID=UPI000BB83A98|nr:copper resistance system multicopper oxidase [Marinobacter sp. LV10R510-11A]SOB75454.1 copper-resistance protein, CopA family [Marinobacter sp. LV10R510-11A]